MSPELREALRGLCRSHGWSAGAFWRLDRRDPRLLVMEESFFEEEEEEQIGTEVDKIITHVHVVGDGHIGASALSGKHQWIYSNPGPNEEIFKGIDEIERMFSVGMKTIAIIPLLSFGVAQFGSAQKISESLEFIHQVQRMFHRADQMTGHFSYGDSSGLASFSSISSLQEVISKELQAELQSSTTASLWPIGPCSSTMPAAVTLSSLSSSQYGASSADHHAISPPDSLRQFTYTAPAENSATVPDQLASGIDLFEGMELDLNPTGGFRKACWDDLAVLPSDNNGTCSNFGKTMSDGVSGLDMASTTTVADKCFFSESSFEQLLEAVVVGGSSMPSTVTSVNSLDVEHRLSALARTADHPKKTSKEAYSKSYDGSWLDEESVVTDQPKKPEETAKVVAKRRARPGESTRPRPKDRQQIQDRVKELREIVPRSSKCSIDSLLDRTIKHMLFLQNVTKYADKLKHTDDEPKMIGDESGVVLKDDSGSGCTGATWAYEVAGQTMVCPILVEDLNPPGQMLVEMLCEEQGFFLEIADTIRGFGLTILKGVMEIHDTKIWTRFLVEANRGVTRMDIFLSLVQLSQQTSSICDLHEQQTRAAVDTGPVSAPFTSYQPSPVSIPVGLADRLQ